MSVDETAVAARAERFSRQERYPRVGREGQARLAAARVIIVGVGATGGNLAQSLARAGVGHLTLVDRDVPEWHNLQRQVLLDADDVTAGRPKAIAAARHLEQIDPDLSVTPMVTDVHADNVLGLARGHDLILDGTDNFAVRMLLNDAALDLGIPWIYAAVIGAGGAEMAIRRGGQPCLACLYPELPPAGSVDTCDTAGVLQPAVAVVAGIAALDALRILLGAEPEAGLLHVDLWPERLIRLQVAPQPGCLSCVERRYRHLAGEASDEPVAATLCGRNAVHLRPPPTTIDLPSLAARLAAATRVTLANDHLVQFDAGAQSLTVFADGRALVHGTDDPATARSLYARYVGY